MRRDREPVASDRFVEAMNSLLDNAMVGVVYLDRHGKIVEANTRARAILRRGDGLEDRAGFLRARGPADDVRLGSLLARVLPGGERPDTGDSIAVQRSSKLPRLAVHVSPVTVDRQEGVVSRAAALALIVDPAVKPCIDSEHVAAILGLTRAESRVAAALAEGASVREIAAGTKRKESSVRWLIKNIYAKLDISRTADLVRMVLTAALAAGPRPTSPSSSAQDTELPPK